MATGEKTYWHLRDGRRLPSEYEIGTSRLLYYVERGGFAVDLPTSGWYRRHQSGSPLVCARWEDFADPRATTYGAYVRMQRDQEVYLTRLLDDPSAAARDASLPADWLDTMERTLSPLRFVFHGLQMIAAYVGQMAPSGRITVAALFQAADEIRRTHGVAHRMAQFRRQRPDFGASGRQRWQDDPAWQPLRRTIERLLITYDWGETLVALNVCVKPVLDHLFTQEMATLAEGQGDFVDAQLLRSFAVDSAWQRDWTLRLLRMVAARDAGSQTAIHRWMADWRPLMEDAVGKCATVLGSAGASCAQKAISHGAAFVDLVTSTGKNDASC